MAKKQKVEATAFAVEFIAIDSLKPHPRNYLIHPEDELLHLEQSLRENGFYKNVVTANELTILAGHGVVVAARRIGMDKIPVIRLPIEPESKAALKILAGDNEVGHLAEIDDRMLTDMLQELKIDGLLLGTGYDEMMLAARLFSTRSEDEIKDLDAAKEWVGMPEYEESKSDVQLILNFQTEKARVELIKKLKLVITRQNRKTLAAWYPPSAKKDIKSVKFDHA